MYSGWNSRYSSTNWFYSMFGIKPRVSYMLGKQEVSGTKATSLALYSINHRKQTKYIELCLA